MPKKTFDICWGTEPTVEAMTNVILADQKLKSTSPTEFKGEITADKDSKSIRHPCQDRVEIECLICSFVLTLVKAS